LNYSVGDNVQLVSLNGGIPSDLFSIGDIITITSTHDGFYYDAEGWCYCDDNFAPTVAPNTPITIPPKWKDEQF